MIPESLTVVGLGAIGGSLAWQATRAGIRRVIGYSPRPAERIAALKAGAVSDVADSAARAVRGARLVVLAAPPAATLALIDELASRLEPGAILTDVCSVKAVVVERAVRAGLGAVFAGSHPLAGTHDSGFQAARPERLPGAVVYVTPTGVPGGDVTARGVMGFWREVLRAEPVLIDAEAHDRQLAWTSHLPQAMAYALARTLADRELGPVSFGPGARDTTRLAASSPELWVDILLHNRGPILEALGAGQTRLARLRALVAAGDAAGLRDYLDGAAAFRRGLDR
ncbi:MAG TPA: prephenate dehydrogenase [Gemmatimonadales bacterium]|nr:prephenate dehydrogenase [Gemmatimonadales bacterium]